MPRISMPWDETQTRLARAADRAFLLAGSVSCGFGLAVMLSGLLR